MRILFLGTLYCGTKLGEYNLQLGIKMEGMYFPCKQSNQCHFNVGTGLGILLPDVQSVFARRPKEYLRRALLPLLKVVERTRVLESAATKFGSWLCLIPAG